MGRTPSLAVAADTNVLLRIAVRDDIAQAQAAEVLLARASFIVVSLTSLCEFVWVLRSAYEYSRSDIAAAIRTLLNTFNLSVDRTAVEAGLNILSTGGDFADGVVAYEGRLKGGSTFVSFDKKAVVALQKQGFDALLLR